MKKKMLMLLSILILVTIGISIYVLKFSPTGTTVEEREKLLFKHLNGQVWNISTETKIDGYIVSGTYSNNGKSGIAIFRPVDNGGFKMQNHLCCSSDTIILNNLITGEKSYNIIWFNGAATDYAEVIYSNEGKVIEELTFDTKDMPIIYNESPSDSYEIKVSYHDSNGNVFE